MLRSRKYRCEAPASAQPIRCFYIAALRIDFHNVITHCPTSKASMSIILRKTNTLRGFYNNAAIVQMVGNLWFRRRNQVPRQAVFSDRAAHGFAIHGEPAPKSRRVGVSHRRPVSCFWMFRSCPWIRRLHSTEYSSSPDCAGRRERVLQPLFGLHERWSAHRWPQLFGCRVSAAAVIPSKRNPPAKRFACSLLPAAFPDFPPVPQVEASFPAPVSHSFARRMWTWHRLLQQPIHPIRQHSESLCRGLSAGTTQARTHQGGLPQRSPRPLVPGEYHPGTAPMSLSAFEVFFPAFVCCRLAPLHRVSSFGAH